MTKYTIFCVLGLALLIQGAKQWMVPASKPSNNSSAANSETGDIEPLTKTAHADSLGVPHPSNNDSPQASPAIRQPDRSFTPGSTFLAQAVRDNTEAPPGKTDAVPSSVMVASSEPAPLVIKPTFVPQPREANPNAIVMSKPNSPPLEQAADPADERPRLPADFATKEATTSAESASMIADATAKSSSIPSFTMLKPIKDDRVELQFPTTANMQIQLGGNTPISPYGQAGPDSAGQLPITNVQRLNEARNPAQVKADSLASHNLLQGAQLAYQSRDFPAQNRLEGKELTLQDLFILTPDREKRFALLKAYWKVALAMAEYHWAVEENYTIQRLNAISGQASTSHRYIEAAIYSSISRVSETRTQTINAQYELLTLMGGQFRTMPLCVDVPLVGTYNTQFDVNFPNGRAPTRLRAISQTVDLRRDVVNTRCLAINTTFDAWAKSAIPLYLSSSTEQNAQVVAIGYEQVTRHRRYFLASIREYNNDIAEYALSVLSPSFRPDQLAGYLTRTPSPRPLWNTSAMVTSDTAEEQPVLANVRTDNQIRPATFTDESAGEDWSQKTRSVLPSVMKQN